MTEGYVDIGHRTDWFHWMHPPPQWCAQHADVPGLQWDGDGEKVTVVTFHRTHFPVMPSDVVQQIPMHAVDAEATRQAQAIEVWLQTQRGITLRRHQAEALPYILSRQHTLLAYEMRLGKTLTATAAHNPNQGVFVAVGPLAARDTWREWIKRVHDIDIYICQGRKPDLEAAAGHRAYFCHFDVLNAWTRLFAGMQIETLVIDEIHKLQNRKSQRTSAVQACSFVSKRIIGLTGTPMWGVPDSMYAQLHLIAPGAWGSHFVYAGRYCDAQPSAHGWTYNGSSNEQEFGGRIEHIMLRKTWRDAAPNMPPTVRSVEPVAVPIKTMAAIESKAINKSLITTTAKPTVAGYLATLRRMMADVKVKPGVDAAVDAINNGHPKVVMWTWHKEVQDAVVKEAYKRKIMGLKVFKLTADMSANQREKAVADFHSYGGPAIIVSGIGVGGMAIDLSCSDYAIFVELDWIPANNYQAVMRTFHPSRPHCLVFLYADVPIEARLIHVMQVKENFAGALGLGFDEIASLVLNQ